MRIRRVRSNGHADEGQVPVSQTGALRWLTFAYRRKWTSWGIRNIVRGTVPRFTVFIVVLLFACGLCDKVSDLVELQFMGLHFYCAYFFQNTVGQALDSREVVRVRSRTSPVSGLVIRFMGVGQKGAFALRSGGTTLRCLDGQTLTVLLSYLWYHSGFSLEAGSPAHRASRRGSRGRHLALSLVWPFLQGLDLRMRLGDPCRGARSGAGSRSRVRPAIDDLPP
jgi:hypothetical protein